MSRSVPDPAPVWTALDSPVGRLTLVAGQTGLRAILWPDSPALAALSPECRAESPLLQQAGAELSGYFEGTITSFTVPLEWHGTPFQIAVWRALCTIPYGETLTYSAVARQVGKPSAIRAVAQAIGRNPIGIMIPCHRVIGSDGSLTGFAGGLETKAALLALEARYRYATNTFTMRA